MQARQMKGDDECCKSVVSPPDDGVDTLLAHAVLIQQLACILRYDRPMAYRPQTLGDCWGEILPILADSEVEQYLLARGVFDQETE